MIKPCPFCGNKVIKEVLEVSDSHAVFCERCATVGPRTIESKEKAIELWNERVQ